ncbi:facilitated trehalose transporter Tret1-like [Anabrus simplex]|uniref:facilitated trehalose transporter Tret1-like n=1 Tax=Anabrus simplex TaxID=316456 RepID=UPI0034DD7303
MGWASPTLPRLEDGKAEPHITSDESSWIVSCIPIGAVLILVPTGYVTDIIGRKATLLGTAVPFLISWLLIIFAKSVWFLYAAMTFAGMGMGCCFAVGPMYMAEIAQDHIRGAIATIFQVMMNFGVLFSYSVGPYVSTTTLAIICAVFPVIFVLTFIWMPESPYFYLLRNRKEDAEKSLMMLRSASNPESVQEELNAMEDFVQESSKEKRNVIKLFTDRVNRRGLVVVVGLAVFQPLSGNNALLSYSTIIFEESNKDLSPEVSVIITGAVQVVLGIVCSTLIDTAGRRPMLLVSTVGCTLALTIEGLFFYLKNVQGVDMSGYDWVSMLAIILFLITYTVGLGPLPLAMIGELFPASSKGMAASFTTIILSTVGIIVPKLYQAVMDNFGLHVAFWMFAVCCAVGAVFVFFLVPETKGKSLMEINREMKYDP